MTSAYLPRELSELVGEYGDNFRVREGKIDVWAYSVDIANIIDDHREEETEKALKSTIYPWKLLHSYDVTPGVWTATIGASTRAGNKIFTPFIIHKTDFDVSTLPEIKTNIRGAKSGITHIFVTSHVKIGPLPQNFLSSKKYDISTYTRKEVKEGKIIGQTMEDCEDKMLISYKVAEASDSWDTFNMYVIDQTYIVRGKDRIDAIILLLQQSDVPRSFERF